MTPQPDIPALIEELKKYADQFNYGDYSQDLVKRTISALSASQPGFWYTPAGHVLAVLRAEVRGWSRDTLAARKVLDTIDSLARSQPTTASTEELLKGYADGDRTVVPDNLREAFNAVYDDGRRDPLNPSPSAAASTVSVGKHNRFVAYGEIDLCDTCFNSSGHNVAWEQAHSYPSANTLPTEETDAPDTTVKRCGGDTDWIDPCPCVRPQGHAGFHSCTHEHPIDAVEAEEDEK